MSKNIDSPFKIVGVGRYVARFELPKDDCPGTVNHLEIEIQVDEDDPQVAEVTLYSCGKRNGAKDPVAASRVYVSLLASMLYGAAKLVTRQTLEPL